MDSGPARAARAEPRGADRTAGRRDGRSRHATRRARVGQRSRLLRRPRRREPHRIVSARRRFSRAALYRLGIGRAEGGEPRRARGAPANGRRAGTGGRCARADAAAVPRGRRRSHRLGTAVLPVDSPPRPGRDHRRRADRFELSRSRQRGGARAGDGSRLRAGSGVRAESPRRTARPGDRPQADLRRSRDRAAGQPAG